MTQAANDLAVLALRGFPYEAVIQDIAEFTRRADAYIKALGDPKVRMRWSGTSLADFKGWAEKAE